MKRGIYHIRVYYIQQKNHDVQCIVEVILFMFFLTQGLMFETWISLAQVTCDESTTNLWIWG